MSIALKNAQAIVDSANEKQIHTLGLEALLLNAKVVIDTDTGLLVIHTTCAADANEVNNIRANKMTHCPNCNAPVKPEGMVFVDVEGYYRVCTECKGTFGVDAPEPEVKGALLNPVPQEDEDSSGAILDVVTCANCNFSGEVSAGAEVCPSCNAQGTLMWSNQVPLDKSAPTS